MNSDRITYTEAQLAGNLRDSASKNYLSTYGLPAQNVLFQANSSPHVLDIAAPPMTYLVIGRTTAGLLIGLDSNTGEVVAINRTDDNRAWHANTDIEKFVSSVEEFDDRWPFYKCVITAEQLEESAIALSARLADIDPTSLRDKGGFWQGLIFDVGLGDYSDGD